MALSSVSYVGTGSQTEFFFTNISLLDDDIVTYASQLKVYIDGTLKTLTTDYSVNVNNKKIVFGSAPALGTIVKIARFSKSDDRYITYTNSTNITASILNTDADHLFHLAQEALDLRDNAITLNDDDKYEGNAKVITNIAPGVDSTDAINYGQLIAAISGDNPGVLGTQGYYTAVGDGSTVNYTLPTSVSGLTASDFNVYVNGSKKIPTTDYTVSGVVLTFTSAPTNTHVIQILWNIGTVPARFGEGNVTTTMLQDEAVTIAKIGSAAATSNQVLKADGSGGASFGTIPASIISDFDTQVRTSRLDQMAVPTASVNFNSQRLLNVAAPSASTDAINRNYLDTKYQQFRRYVIVPGTVAGQSTNNQRNFVTSQAGYQQTLTLTHDLSNVLSVKLVVPIVNNSTSTTAFNKVDFEFTFGNDTFNTQIYTTEAYTAPNVLIGSAVPIAFTCQLVKSSGQLAFTVTAIGQATSTNYLVHNGSATPAATSYATKDWHILLTGV